MNGPQRILTLIEKCLAEATAQINLSNSLIEQAKGQLREAAGDDGDCRFRNENKPTPAPVSGCIHIHKGSEEGE